MLTVFVSQTKTHLILSGHKHSMSIQTIFTSASLHPTTPNAKICIQHPQPSPPHQPSKFPNPPALTFFLTGSSSQP